MESITIFLKKRQRNKLLNKIEKLRIQSAHYKGTSDFFQICADKTLSLIEFHLTQAYNGDVSSSCWLDSYLYDYLLNYIRYSEKSAINLDNYKNIKNRVGLLEEQFNNL